MISRNLVAGHLILAVFLTASCREDVTLVEKKHNQSIEITRLKGEIAMIEEKLKNLPPDVSAELESKRKDVAEQEAEIKRREAGIRELEEQGNSLQREFDAYRAKYSIN